MEKYFEEVESINHEAQQFLFHLRRFRKNVNAKNETLHSNFLKFVSEIENFLESKLKEVSISNTKELVNLNAAGIRSNFVCTKCKKQIDLFKQVHPHILSREHRLNSRREANKNATISMKARLKNKMLPQKVKLFLLGDSQTLFMNSLSVPKQSNLEVVQHLLEKSPGWVHMRAIPNARVPILRTCHASTSIACDIGFSNSLAFCNTKLIQYFLEMQPIAKALCIVLKKFFQKIKLSKYITTYSVVFLVVFYLQVKKQLPSVKTLQDDLEDPVEIGPWIATFSEKSLEDLNIRKSCVLIGSLRQELKQFFTFYSSFNFSEDLICPYLGHIVSMDKMGEAPLLQRYAKYIESEKDTNDSLFENSDMNVQAPFQLNYNITNMVPATAVLLMKQYFELSANVLSDAALIIPVKMGIDSVQNSTT